MLRVINLASADRDYKPAMSYKQYEEELAKPRGERMGLYSMSADMCCTGDAAVRMGESIARVSAANAAARARGMANASYSATNR